MNKHWHHIIPRHAGGTDDPSNLVELSVEEHAEAHRKLYEEYGRWEDKVAWLGLTGQIGQDEIIKEKQSNGGRKAGIIAVESGHLKSISSSGGKVSGKIAVETGQIQALGKLYGKIIGPILKEEKRGIFGLSEEERKKNSSQGGKTSGRNNVENGHLASIRSKAGRASSTVEWTCPHCGKTGKGNGFRGYHITKVKCQIKNKD